MKPLDIITLLAMTAVLVGAWMVGGKEGVGWALVILGITTIVIAPIHFCNTNRL